MLLLYYYIERGGVLTISCLYWIVLHINKPIGNLECISTQILIGGEQY